jgi:serine/threonine protein kinase
MLSLRLGGFRITLALLAAIESTKRTSRQVGDKLGRDEILGPIGVGGMGEVYRARDTKLNRDVAIKVLSAAVANDADYMARFQREAQVLASLNHPHIATIYGLEQSNGIRALVMELVEGPTLAERMSGRVMP